VVTWADVVLLCLAYRGKIRREKKTLKVSKCFTHKQGLQGASFRADNPSSPPKCMAPKKGQHLVRLTLEELAPKGTGHLASSSNLERLQMDGKRNCRRGTASPSAPGKCNLFLRLFIRHLLDTRAWNWLKRDKAP